jgi:hypothetical protein
MRRIVSLLVFVLVAPSPSWAANKIQQVTVAQLSQWLTGAHRLSDGKMAKKLEAMVLTERVSATQLAQWQSTLPGRHSRDALTALADNSILLLPPPAEMLTDPPPDFKNQGAILSHAIDYVVQTVTKLPDFYATRTTQHFQDAPVRVGAEHIMVTPEAASQTGLLGNTALKNIGGVSQQIIAAQPLHYTGQTTVQVSYRDGVEMRGAEKMDRASINRPDTGLTTAGEFGPILSVVLDDAVHGSVEWGYWQQSHHGNLAVLRYTVAEGHSSYLLALKHGMREEKLFPAYHGEIAIDPATGAILRISIAANSLRSQNVMESAIVVEYGSVALGGKDYICPIRGVAVLRTVLDSGSLQTQINDTTFTGYHLMRGDVRILPDRQ